MLSLVMAPLNVNYKILRIKSLGDSNITESHLANLGFVKDAVIKVVNENDGNLIVYVKDSRFALGKDIAKNSEIYIRKVAPLGDPVQINIRNYELSIRKADAELIAIEEIEKKED